MLSMMVAFRVDASTQIGTGHFMRCLTLADRLRQTGNKTRFLSRHLTTSLSDMLASRGHDFILSNTTAAIGDQMDDLTHSNWLGTSQQQDADETKQALQDQKWDWLVVDHYGLDLRWEARFRELPTRILVIDDLADRKHDCDILLDQNYYLDMHTRYADLTPKDCLLLLGPRYVLLREEFTNYQNHEDSIHSQVNRLLVLFGGIDVNNDTQKVIAALRKLDHSFEQVDVVIGAQHPNAQQISSDCSKLGFQFHQQSDQIAALMANADLAIGACGFTCYEFIAMNLPALVIPASPPQNIVANLLSDLQVVQVLQRKNVDIADDIYMNLKHLMHSQSQRAKMIRSCHDFLDTKGAERVTDLMLRLKN